jgi:hypothetical protein
MMMMMMKMGTEMVPETSVVFKLAQLTSENISFLLVAVDSSDHTKAPLILHRCQ